MDNIIQNLKRNKDNKLIVQSVLLRKIGSSGTPQTPAGITFKNIIQLKARAVNLVIVTASSPAELYVVYYDNQDMNKATSECVVQINFTNKQINLTETSTGQALVREYTTQKSQTCQNIIKFITDGDGQNVYNLSLGKNTYPVQKHSIIDKLNVILTKLSNSSDASSKSSSESSSRAKSPSATKQNLSKLTSGIAQDPAAQAMALGLASAAANTAIGALSTSPHGKMALGAFDMFKQISNNPLAQQLASVAMSAASDQMAKSPRGKSALQAVNMAKAVAKNLKGGYSDYVDLASIY